MNDDRDWAHLADAWKTGSPVQAAAPPAPASMKAHIRYASWKGRLMVLLTCAMVAAITLACMRQQSAARYTFTVIAWSGFFAFGSYWLSARDSIGDVTLPTTAHLSTRATRLRRSAQWLDFGRSLIGVETVICVGFWIVLRPGAASQVWPIAATIVCGGLLLYTGLTWVLARTRREMAGLESMAAAMQSGTEHML